MKKAARFTVYTLLGTFDRALKRENNLVIYCYHNLTNNPWLFHVSPSTFKKQMAYLSSIGNFVSLKDIELYLQGKKQLPQKAFAITFDDGYRGVKTALPVVKKLGIKPSVFVLPHVSKVDRTEIANHSELLSAKEIHQLEKSGWEIGYHGLTHKKLTRLTKAQMQKEVSRPKGLNYFAYPHGKYNAEIETEVQKQNYKLAFSMNDQLLTMNSDRFAIPRVGVMGDHTDAEFKYLASPSVLAFRKLVKSTMLRKYL